MKSSFKLVAMVMVVGILCVGVLALATDFVWDINTVDTNWRTINNWDLDSSYPQNFNDNADITSGGNTITMNDTSTLLVNRITLGGASPTKRKLHVKDAAILAKELHLQDYAEIDADKDLIVLNHTEISGNVWIDIADNTTVTLQEVDQDTHALHVESSQARLILTTGSGALLTVEGILIDADTANAARSLKVDGGAVLVPTGGVLEIRSDTAADNKRAKLWIAGGTFDMQAGANIEMIGGSTNARRAELDLDVSVTVNKLDIYDGIIDIDGYAAIDLAANKTLCTPLLRLGYASGGAVATLVTGSGASMKVNTAECP